ncbi:TPA: hypothetical protein ACQ39K_004973, partial [Yersinia enterocolitica]
QAVFFRLNASIQTDVTEQAECFIAWSPTVDRRQPRSRPGTPTVLGTFGVPLALPCQKYMGNNFRSFRFLLPQQQRIGDLFP